MADDARQYTDAELYEIEKELERIYKRSQKELMEEWDKYMKDISVTLGALWLAYQNAPDDATRTQALKDYQDAVQNKTLRNQWYRKMVENTTRRLAHVNQIAADYVNGRIPDIYYVNYQQAAQELFASGYDIPQMQTAWDIRSEQTMQNLAMGNIDLPTRKVNTVKDMVWNMRQINSTVLQGVLMGESIRDITKRLMPIVNNNEKSAVRAARTMVTGAENKGRQDSYNDLESEGAVLNKVWIATPDARVRDWHLSMDGQEVGIHDKFTDGNGDKLDYPGDAKAPGRTVWNCRCTMRSQILGFRRSDGTIQPLKRHEHNGLHQQQIAQEKANRG